MLTIQRAWVAMLVLSMFLLYTLGVFAFGFRSGEFGRPDIQSGIAHTRQR